MAKLYHSITELVGNTPLLELHGYEKKFGLKAHIFAKLEYFNPAGSVKDRIVLSMIEKAEKEGALKPGQTIVETTSGNTGIAAAALAAAKGYSSRIYIMDNVSRERSQIIKAYGGEVFTFSETPEIHDTLEATNHDFFAAVNELKKKFAKENVYFLDQDKNPANPYSHYNGTAKEIWEATDGKVDAFVAGVGTGGTISGNGKFFKEKNKNIKIFAVQPELEEEGITGVHPVEGLPEGRLPGNLDYSVFDESPVVKLSDAYETARAVAKTDGILVGISSGASLWAATQVAKRKEFEGKNIVALLPDTGLRYLSTPLFGE